MKSAGAGPTAPDSTALERRVLAHERILQCLIAYMSKTEPRCVDHLREYFVDPLKGPRQEHDYRDVDDYAEEFMRAIMRMGTPGGSPGPDGGRVDIPDAPLTATGGHAAPPRGPSERVQMKEAYGIWHVTVNGAFWGDFHKREQALSAISLAKLSLH